MHTSIKHGPLHPARISHSAMHPPVISRETWLSFVRLPAGLPSSSRISADLLHHQQNPLRQLCNLLPLQIQDARASYHSPLLARRPPAHPRCLVRFGIRCLKAAAFRRVLKHNNAPRDQHAPYYSSQQLSSNDNDLYIPWLPPQDHKSKSPVSRHQHSPAKQPFRHRISHFRLHTSRSIRGHDYWSHLSHLFPAAGGSLVSRAAG